MNIIFYFDTKKAHMSHATDAPVIAVTSFSRGYNPIYTHSTAETLNKDIPEDVLESALAASMFGWDCLAAMPARLFIEKKEKENKNEF